MGAVAGEGLALGGAMSAWQTAFPPTSLREISRFLFQVIPTFKILAGIVKEILSRTQWQQRQAQKYGVRQKR